MSAMCPAGDFMSTNEEEARKTLILALNRLPREKVTGEFGISDRTLERWEGGPIPNPGLVLHALRSLMRSEPDAASTDFTFIDLFAGIGGMRLGMEAAGGKCVYTSEYDKFCQITYRANHKPDHEIAGDITLVNEHSIPDHDVLVAGFPCQPFSIAGVSKKNALGRAHGFECDTQGTLFFDICRILKAKKPTAFLLENVRNLQSHDKKKTFQVIQNSLRELGYHISFRVLDARYWVPQHRERIFIVGFREPTAFDMDLVPVPGGEVRTLADVLHPQNGSEKLHEVDDKKDYIVGSKGKVHDRFTLTPGLWDYLQRYKAKHEAAGNGFGFGLVTKKSVARTLSARYYKDGSEILVSRGAGKPPRRLTPRECARLMGYKPDFQIPVSDTQAYKQFGNSVAVPVVEAVATAMKPYLLALKTNQRDQIAMIV